MKKFSLNILKFSLPLLFIAYVACISLFTHSHVVNGVTIVHSHPFDKDSQHSHTASQFQLIYLLTHLQLADGAVTLLIVAMSLVLLRRLSYELPRLHIQAHLRGVLSLRAPPVAV